MFRDHSGGLEHELEERDVHPERVGIEVRGWAGGAKSVVDLRFVSSNHGSTTKFARRRSTGPGYTRRTPAPRRPRPIGASRMRAQRAPIIGKYRRLGARDCLGTRHEDARTLDRLALWETRESQPVAGDSGRGRFRSRAARFGVRLIECGLTTSRGPAPRRGRDRAAAWNHTVARPRTSWRPGDRFRWFLAHRVERRPPTTRFEIVRDPLLCPDRHPLRLAGRLDQMFHIERQLRRRQAVPRLGRSRRRHSRQRVLGCSISSDQPGDRLPRQRPNEQRRRGDYDRRSSDWCRTADRRSPRTHLSRRPDVAAGTEHRRCSLRHLAGGHPRPATGDTRRAWLRTLKLSYGAPSDAADSP